ncbi:MAG: hypothetical protein QXG98_01230 [Candidatus Micrarchaeia archaeon]
MRGFFSFLLVAIALSALLAASHSYLNNVRMARSAEWELLLIERAHAAEMDAKHALLDGIRQDARALSASHDISAALAWRLRSLEHTLTQGDFHGFNASLWCGAEGVPLEACARLIVAEPHARRLTLMSDIIIVLRSPEANFTSFIPAGVVVSY